MPGPLSGVQFIHQAFRNDLQRSQAEIKFWATLGDGDPQAMHDRFSMFHESLALHEMAEEELLFPVVNGIEAGRADVFIQSHRLIDPLRNGILDALKAQNADNSFDGIMELVPLKKGTWTRRKATSCPGETRKYPSLIKATLRVKWGNKSLRKYSASWCRG
jgi:hypothetical protein